MIYKITRSRRLHTQCHLGFSLIELLVVVALVALLAVLAVPAFISVAQGTGMRRAVSSLSDSIEMARSEAMAKSTWVWLGLADTTLDNQGRTPQVTIAMVASKDGTTNSAANNILQVIKPIKVENVKILSALSKWASNSTVPLKGSAYGFSVTIGGAAQSFSDTVLAFSPQGEVLLDAGRVYPWIEVGVREVRGNSDIHDKEASVRVSGVSGQVLVTY